jgi:Tfp pilus assembly protein PilV
MTANAGQPRCRQDGFSLVETTAGLLIGATVLLAFAGIIISALQLQASTVSRMELTALAETKLDQLLAHAALPTDDTLKLSVGGSLTNNDPHHAEQMSSARGRVYDVRWVVVPGLNGTRDVTVRVAPVTPAPKQVPHMDVRTLMLIR